MDWADIDDVSLREIAQSLEEIPRRRPIALVTHDPGTESVHWDGPWADWASYDLAVLRSTGDYGRRAG